MWKKQIAEDKELGGADLKKNVEMAHRVLEKFGSKELMEKLDATGLGTYPELIRMMKKIGDNMTEDGFIKGSPPGGEKKSAAKILYNQPEETKKE